VLFGRGYGCPPRRPGRRVEAGAPRGLELGHRGMSLSRNPRHGIPRHASARWVGDREHECGARADTSLSAADAAQTASASATKRASTGARVEPCGSATPETLRTLRDAADAAELRRTNRLRFLLTGRRWDALRSRIGYGGGSGPVSVMRGRGGVRHDRGRSRARHGARPIRVTELDSRARVR